MTSGNLSGEPIVTDDDDALDRLAGLADAWLTHDRPIHVPCDDSVTRAVGEGEAPVRRSRGYAPLPIGLPFDAPPSLAVGGDLKNTFCLAEGRLAWMSGHIGDMDDLATQRAFGAAVRHLSMLTGVEPEAVGGRPPPGVPLPHLGPRPVPRRTRSSRSSTTTPTSPRRWPSTGWSTAAG